MPAIPSYDTPNEVDHKATPLAAGRDSSLSLVGQIGGANQASGADHFYQTETNFATFNPRVSALDNLLNGGSGANPNFSLGDGTVSTQSLSGELNQLGSTVTHLENDLDGLGSSPHTADEGSDQTHSWHGGHHDQQAERDHRRHHDHAGGQEHSGENTAGSNNTSDNPTGSSEGANPGNPTVANPGDATSGTPTVGNSGDTTSGTPTVGNSGDTTSGTPTVGNSGDTTSGTPTTSSAPADGLIYGIESKPNVGNGGGYPQSDTQIAQQIAALGGQINYVPAPFDMTNPQSVANLQAVVSADQAAGLQTAVEMNVPWGDTTPPAQAYQNMFAQGQALAKAFPSITTVLMGDELDGSSLGYQYSGTTWDSTVADLQGLYAGLKSVNPNIQTEINATTTGVENGYFQALQAAGVQWDVTGIHPYVNNLQSDLVAPLQAAVAIGKPISISEFDANSPDGQTGPNADPQRQADLITQGLQYIQSVAQQDNIKDVIAYELYDESGQTPPQDNYGIMTASGQPTAASQAIQNIFTAAEQPS